MAGRGAKLAVTGALLTLSLGLYGAHDLQRDSDSPLPRLEQQSADAEREQARQSAVFRQALARLDERLVRYPNDLEARLFKGLLHFKQGHLGEALEQMDDLVRRAPKFHLAHLIRGDLLLAQTQPVTDIGATPLLAGRTGLDELRQEAEARLGAFLDSLPQDRLPRALLGLGDSVDTAIVVDKEGHRLYVYGRDPNGVPSLQQDFYVSTGKLAGNKNLRGDLRTPEGVYFVTSHIPANRLPDKYGSGAYPVNYPNELDLRLGKTGYGIWLHGTEGGYYSRPPLDSEGCVVLPNLDLTAVGSRIAPGSTPVIITEQVSWMERSEWEQTRDRLLAEIEAWRSDWESGDVEAYLSHYAKDFWSGKFNLASWSDRKRRVARGKRFQQVELKDLSLFGYPASATDRPIVVASFHQDYNSNNFSSSMGKRLYLTLEDGDWKVLYEGGR